MGEVLDFFEFKKQFDKNTDILTSYNLLLRKSDRDKKSKKDIIEFLIKKGLDKSLAEDIVDRAECNNDYNENKAALKIALKYAASSLKGEKYLKQVLRQKRFSPKSIDYAISHIDKSVYLDAILKIVNTKFKNADAADIKTYLLTRGFSKDIIDKALQKYSQ